MKVQLRWGWWHDRVAPEWQLQGAVFVAPCVLAVLACWGLEATRRPPHIRTSA